MSNTGKSARAALPERGSARSEQTGTRRVVIIGGGFGGLACARAMAGGAVRVTVIDRRNHHLFQPLLYQVATAALSPADIATPIRQILASAKNIDVLLAEVDDIDLDTREVRLVEGESIAFDQLVVATGSAYNYFGHTHWAEHAPAPKSIGDARHIRARLLKAFEDAERCMDPDRRAALLTTIVVGGGPTGVEMAGTIAELARHTLRGNFRHIDPTTARVILVEGGKRILSGFPERLSTYAVGALANLGVEVRINSPVEEINACGVRIAGRTLEAGTVVWGAGITAEAGANWFGGTEDRGGRIPVDSRMAVIGHRDIYALGDVALFRQDGVPLPALAQVAQQQGRHLGRALRRGRAPSPFQYHSRGDTAVIGRNAAVFMSGRFVLKGRLAWLLWCLVHVYLLIGFQRRTRVMLQWIWRYFTFERGARLID